jgi:HK97 family phage major capsid protein/HK97 family phage prohead protease
METTTMTKTLKPGTRAERSFLVTRAAIDEAARTVELAFSSEEPYDRYWGREILDHSKKSVRLGRLKGSGPLLCDHDATDIVGVIESVRIDADLVGRAVVRFGKSERAAEVWQDVVDGIRTNVSVGYVIHKAQLVETGDQSIDTYRVTDWEPYEISLVSVPADATVGIGRAMDDSPVITEAAAPIPNQEKTMPEINQAADLAAAETRAADAARQAESRRVNEILAVGEEHDDIGGEALARAAIKDGLSVADFQKKLLEAKRSGAGQVQYGQGARTRDNLADDPKRGFANYGDYCAEVVRASTGKGGIDRLERAATTYGAENNGPDGGYAVPPQFASEIASLAYGETSLLALADNTPVSGNTMTFPKDETTPWGSTGITAAWEGEGNQSTPKKPALGESTLKLRKLKVLVAASDELLADAAAMSAYITRKTGEAVDWKVNDAIINGNGAGMPLGIMNASATVSQAKESGQAAATIVAKNIAKMYARCLMGAGANLVWLVNPDAFPEIVTLTLNNNPIWVPANQGFSGAPNGLLLGRPVILTDACQTLGTVGDIILANMAGGAEFAQSMHLWFDQDLMAFRLIVRMDGQTALGAAVSPANGSTTRSHFVTLATRS